MFLFYSIVRDHALAKAKSNLKPPLRQLRQVYLLYIGSQAILSFYKEPAAGSTPTPSFQKRGCGGIVWRMKKNETIVISVGGSLIVPDTIDTRFLKKLKQLIQKHIAHNTRFLIISGGGKTARSYQAAGNAVTKLSDTDLDWIGIHATRLNAHLLRAIFFKEAHPVIITNPLKDALPKKSHLIIAAGFQPGGSTDLRAVQLAKRLHATKLINLTNTDGVYDKDPKKHKTAQRFGVLSWRDFRALLPKKWDPGLSAPFDPVAAAEAEKLGLEVLILNGNKLNEFEKALKGKSFLGTRVS